MCRTVIVDRIIHVIEQCRDYCEIGNIIPVAVDRLISGVGDSGGNYRLIDGDNNYARCGVARRVDGGYCEQVSSVRKLAAIKGEGAANIAYREGRAPSDGAFVRCDGITHIIEQCLDNCGCKGVIAIAGYRLHHGRREQGRIKRNYGFINVDTDRAAGFVGGGIGCGYDNGVETVYQIGSSELNVCSRKRDTDRICPAHGVIAGDRIPHIIEQIGDVCCKEGVVKVAIVRQPRRSTDRGCHDSLIDLNIKGDRSRVRGGVGSDHGDVICAVGELVS